jgi:putative PIG3 family NAD(P)H quinone oxidoreductase
VHLGGNTNDPSEGSAAFDAVVDCLPAMKYLQASVDGDGYRVVLAEGPVPVPAADEVLVKVAASGVNRADLSQIAGRYPPPPGESEILGMELSGVVAGTGEEVMALVAGGAHAEYVAVPRGQILPVPKRLALGEAAAIPEAFLTAYLNVVVEGGLPSGGAALIHAGASGVGLAAISMAKLLGARVAATTRTAAKLSALEAAGADLSIDTSSESFSKSIEEAWGRNAIDVVLDPVGAQTFAGNLEVLAVGGRIVVIATLSGATAELSLSALMGKRARVIGSTLRSRPRPEKAELIARLRREIVPAFDDGRLSVAIDSTYPPQRAADAFARMRRNENVGKIVIDWSGL